MGRNINLSRFRQDPVGANRQDGGVIRVLVIVENVSRIVDDRVCGACNPVTDGVVSSAIQIRVGCLVICLEEENTDLIGTVHSVRFVERIKGA